MFVYSELSLQITCSLANFDETKHDNLQYSTIITGLGFVSLQALQYYGYIQVDHAAIKKELESALDLNKDGKVDMEDAEIAKDKVMEVLQIGVPSGGGFAVGFVSGIRTG